MHVLPHRNDDSRQERLTHAQAKALIARERRASQAHASLAKLIASVADEGERQPADGRSAEPTARGGSP
jgi:hypothetical protein